MQPQLPLKFRWKCDNDNKRAAISKKIKSVLKLKSAPVLPENLNGMYGTNFCFELPTGVYRFAYMGGDTPKGGIYLIIKL